MLVVKLELWPFGSEARKTTLGVMHIVNDGTGAHELGNYDVRLWKGAAAPSVVGRKPVDSSKMTARVVDYPRTLHGPWTLVYEALCALVATKKRGGV